MKNKFLNFLDYKLGRIVFANDNNFILNLIGSIKLRNRLFKKKDELDINGFKFLDSLNKFEISNFYSKCLKKINRNNFKSFSNTENALRYNLDSEDIQNAFKIIKNNTISDQIKKFYNSNFIVTNLQLYRTLPFDSSIEKEQYSNFWHCDHYMKTLLKVFIFLHDVRIENGPFEYFDIYQTKKIVKKGFSGRNKCYENSIFTNFKKKSAIGDVGQGFICRTTECIHRATIPHENKYRDILQFDIFPSANLELDNFKNNLSPELSKKFGKIRL